MMANESEENTGTGSRAPSLVLWYDDDKPGDILVQDICVPTSGLTKYTYYCGLQWNGGTDGGGYCGIQDHPRGRNFIYSIWDPCHSKEALKGIYKAPGTEWEKFGGEGTGLKTWNFDHGWDADQWYTLATRRWDCESHTYFGFWVHDQRNRKWTHVVTVDFPLPSILFTSKTASFLEDWHGTGHNARCVRLKEGYKRHLDGTWIPFHKAKFMVVKEKACEGFNESFDAGASSECYFMQSGACTTPSTDLVTTDTLERKNKECKNVSLKPNQEAIEFDISKVTPTEVTWDVPASSTPQFRYRVTVDDEVIQSYVDPQKRTCAINTNEWTEGEVTLEDIYGNEISKTFTFPK